ncbi:nucleotidyltransferase domain-containing protein, partial [Candidatus Babeliales bacterium]|nr:nucleotidyltransferase domain-containing protein [Candidatus Babeliales bacterium]
LLLLANPRPILKEKIKKELEKIEETFGVKVLFAVESGSRAWGFPSDDSDYDVRFIYAYPKDWYLSVFEKEDVIILPIDDDLDINGWDIRKTFRLLYKSNPALLEWFKSPIVYRINERALAPLRSLVDDVCMYESLCHHYLSMAKTHIVKFKSGEKVKIKKYLYTLRPLLCCQWVASFETQPPILFDDLLDKFLPSGDVRRIVDDLLKIKRSTRETDFVSRSPVLEKYMTDLFDDLGNRLPKNKGKLAVDRFDVAFRKTLDLVNCSYDSK